MSRAPDDYSREECEEGIERMYHPSASEALDRLVANGADQACIDAIEAALLAMPPIVLKVEYERVRDSGGGALFVCGGCGKVEPESEAHWEGDGICSPACAEKIEAASAEGPK